MTWWMFDLVVYTFLIVIGAFLIEVATWPGLGVKKRVKILAVLLAIAWGGVFYGSFIEPHWVIVRDYPVELVDEPRQEITIAVVGDFHVGPYKKEDWVGQVVDEVNKLEPDLILLPGDFISFKREETAMLGPLKNLHAPLGVLAVTGNHDYEGESAPVVMDILEGFGIKVLVNESIELVINDEPLIVAGVSDLWNDGDIFSTMNGMSEEKKVILISHNPDAVLDTNSVFADLIVSGHTHGGQIRLPIIGSIVRVPTILGNGFDKGLFNFESQQLFITPGVGETGPRARLFAHPEISILHVRF